MFLKILLHKIHLQELAHEIQWLQVWGRPGQADSIVPDSEDLRFAEGGSEAVFSIAAWDSVRLEIQQLSCSSGSDWKILVPRCQAIEPQKEAGQWEVGERKSIEYTEPIIPAQPTCLHCSRG